MVQSRNPLPEWPLLSLSSSMAPCFLSLLLLLLSATAGGQHHDHWGHHSARHKSTTSDAPSTQIRQAYKATRFPNVCESTLSDSDSLPPNPSPFDFILATANDSAASLQTTRFMIQSILDAFEKASNINRTNTTRICLEVLSYSDRHLSTAFSIALPAGALVDAHAMAWANTALLYQYDCWSSLKYVNGIAQVSDAMAFTSLPSPPLPSPAPARVFPYPSVPPCWAEQRPYGQTKAFCSIHQDLTDSFRLVYQDRTKKDKGKEGSKRLKSGRGGDLKGRSREGKGSRCKRGEGERREDGAERGLF